MVSASKIRYRDQQALTKAMHIYLIAPIRVIGRGLLLFPKVLNQIPGGDRLVTFDTVAAFGHGRAIVVAEVERQPLRKVDGVNGRVLALVVDVDVRLAGVAGVPALADDLPLGDRFAGFDGHAAVFQVRNHQVGAGFHPNHDMVASRGDCVARERTGRRVRLAIMGRDDIAGNRRNNRDAVTAIIRQVGAAGEIGCHQQVIGPALVGDSGMLVFGEAIPTPDDL